MSGQSTIWQGLGLVREGGLGFKEQVFFYRNIVQDVGSWSVPLLILLVFSLWQN